MLNIISYINNITCTPFYKTIYYVLVLLFFIISYGLQKIYDKKCKFIGEITRIIHHLSVFVIYTGFMAPTNILWLTTTVSMIAFLSWVSLNNTCFLTDFENKVCKNNPKNRFHDIFYYTGTQLEKFNLATRIPFILIVNLFAFARLYEYYKNTVFSIYLNNKKFDIQGHRGDKGEYPENTILSFDQAAKYGVDTLEMDMNMTKDKEIVIYHDKYLNDGTYIKTINLEDVKKYNAKLDSNFPYQKKIDNLPIPTLKEVFEWIKTTNYPNKDTIKFSIEVKTTSDLDTDEEVKEFVEKVIEIIKNSNISENRIIIQSRDERALYYIRKLSQTIPISYLIENDDYDENRNDINDTTIQQAKELKANIVSPDYMLLNKEKVDNLHNHGFKVVPWTVNNLEDLKIVLTYGIDGVITDYPKMIIDYLNEKS